MKIILVFATLLLSVTSSFAQNQDKRFYNTHLKRKDVAPKKGMFYADISPLFFTQNGFGVALGYEVKKVQTGINFVGVSRLKPDFALTLFEKSELLEVNNNLGAEWMFNYFLRPDRRGFYAGSILGYSQFNVKNIARAKSEKAVSVYGDLRVGFRWFPFREYFYIDAAYGFSRKIKSTSSENYTFKSNVSFFPFLNIGSRFSL
jgi:hypothetical protein